MVFPFIQHFLNRSTDKNTCDRRQHSRTCKDASSSAPNLNSERLDYQLIFTEQKQRQTNNHETFTSWATLNAILARLRRGKNFTRIKKWSLFRQHGRHRKKKKPTTSLCDYNCLPARIIGQSEGDLLHCQQTERWIHGWIESMINIECLNARDVFFTSEERQKLTNVRITPAAPMQYTQQTQYLIAKELASPESPTDNVACPMNMGEPVTEIMQIDPHKREGKIPMENDEMVERSTVFDNEPKQSILQNYLHYTDTRKSSALACPIITHEGESIETGSGKAMIQRKAKIVNKLEAPINNDDRNLGPMKAARFTQNAMRNRKSLQSKSGAKKRESAPQNKDLATAEKFKRCRSTSVHLVKNAQDRRANIMDPTEPNKVMKFETTTSRFNESPNINIETRVPVGMRNSKVPRQKRDGERHTFENAPNRIINPRRNRDGFADHHTEANVKKTSMIDRKRTQHGPLCADNNDKIRRTSTLKNVKLRRTSHTKAAAKNLARQSNNCALRLQKLVHPRLSRFYWFQNHNESRGVDQTPGSKTALKELEDLKSLSLSQGVGRENKVRRSDTSDSFVPSVESDFLHTSSDELTAHRKTPKPGIASGKNRSKMKPTDEIATSITELKTDHDVYEPLDQNDEAIELGESSASEPNIINEIHDEANEDTENTFEGNELERSDEEKELEQAITPDLHSASSEDSGEPILRFKHRGTLKSRRTKGSSLSSRDEENIPHRDRKRERESKAPKRWKLRRGRGNVREKSVRKKNLGRSASGSRKNRRNENKRGGAKPRSGSRWSSERRAASSHRVNTERKINRIQRKFKRQKRFSLSTRPPWNISTRNPALRFYAIRPIESNLWPDGRTPESPSNDGKLNHRTSKIRKTMSTIARRLFRNANQMIPNAATYKIKYTKHGKRKRRQRVVHSDHANAESTLTDTRKSRSPSAEKHHLESSSGYRVRKRSRTRGCHRKQSRQIKGTLIRNTSNRMQRVKPKSAGNIQFVTYISVIPSQIDELVAPFRAANLLRSYQAEIRRLLRTLEREVLKAPKRKDINKNASPQRSDQRSLRNNGDFGERCKEGRETDHKSRTKGGGKSFLSRIRAKLWKKKTNPIDACGDTNNHKISLKKRSPKRSKVKKTSWSLNDKIAFWQGVLKDSKDPRLSRVVNEMQKVTDRRVYSIEVSTKCRMSLDEETIYSVQGRPCLELRLSGPRTENILTALSSLRYTLPEVYKQIVFVGRFCRWQTPGRGWTVPTATDFLHETVRHPIGRPVRCTHTVPAIERSTRRK